eukprot:CAMPEP_0172549456 /NCGR_PEP_ID=MMETSP1067-20121228/18544_1 /TAXON_ID=265564 ORGANISM="Thalassiosira punctigera, Strain Tpunct2005C2" /NCGR_SAMPLE_ID=MMETSP1067 /ASSEMBLY_ACC=CAM_ASM_000444 /LENGTH=543 /DNA_ID=CAMNT_0013336847 /DNA_START=193 /DNA_END=1824 /DNA_ORIENTATION=+
MGWEEKAAKAKKGHRPSLKNWERDGLAQTFPPYAEALLTSSQPYSSFKIDNDGGDGKGRRVVERTMSLEFVREALRSSGRSSIIQRQRNKNNSGNSHRRHGGGCCEDMYPVVLDANLTSPKEFHERYEAKCIPVVIRNIPYGGSTSNSNLQANNHDNGDLGDDVMEEEKKDCDSIVSQACNSQQPNGKEWPAVRRWKLDVLSVDPQLSERPLKCGEDDDGYTIRMKLRHFLQYLRHNRDDSPLYIFDATFDKDKYAKRILEDYTVPEYFNEDLLGLVGERRRPPYRWFLVGPCRSGTTVHIDPLGTSAWNTLVHGVKRWVLFPPHVSKSVVKGRKLILPGEDDEAIHYFTTILPRMKRRAAASAGGKDDPYADFECHEFTQYAGETVFVPHGWWHAVLNVTHTVGITQNYCSRRNFDEVWTRTRSGRKKMSCSWRRRLSEKHPDLARRAAELNRRDGFVMWEDDPEEQAEWRKKKAAKEQKRREKSERKKKEREESKKRKQSRTSSSKKEKWGEHRTTERRKEGTAEDDDDGDVVMREFSPDC